MSGDLNHSPADIIQQLLIDQILGTKPESAGTWPIFSTYERDNPDNAVTVYDTAGVVHGRHHATGDTQLHYGIQVRVRAKDHSTGFDKAQDIFNELDNVDKYTVTVGSSTYAVQAVTMTSSIIPLGVETVAGRRRLFTINALVALRMTS